MARQRHNKSGTTGKRRGRRKAADGVTTDQIASAALEMLAKRGLDAFSVRNLAKEMGVGTATIYWHMETRNDLLIAAMSYALRDLEPPDPQPTWQDWFRQLFRRFRQTVRGRRGVAKLIGSRLVANAGIGRDLIEHMLTTLSQAGFDEHDIVQAFNVVVVGMISFTTQELGPEPEDSPEWIESMRSRVHTVNVERHPLTARYLPLLSNRAFTLRWENGTTAPMDASFEAFVDVVISGLESMLRRKRQAAKRHKER